MMIGFKVVTPSTAAFRWMLKAPKVSRWHSLPADLLKGDEEETATAAVLLCAVIVVAALVVVVVAPQLRPTAFHP